MLTKQFCDSGDKALIKFVSFTYLELMKKYLGGRNASNCLNQEFFAKLFEHCDARLAKSFIKPLLKYMLPSQKTDLDSKLGDSEMSGKDAKENTEKVQSRSNY